MKEKIKEIIEIVKLCPESLQEKCFEILLSDALGEHNYGKESSAKINTENQRMSGDSSFNQLVDTLQEDEIKLSDIHAVIKKLLIPEHLSIADINKLYYKENGRIMPLYDNLKSQNLSDQQIELALLSSLDNALYNSNSDLVFDVEELRKRCLVFKCYDLKNFKTILKKKKAYFDTDTFEGTIKLTSEGKGQLITVLKKMI